MNNTNFTTRSSNNNHPTSESDDDFWDIDITEEKRAYDNFFEKLTMGKQQEKQMQFEHQEGDSDSEDYIDKIIKEEMAAMEDEQKLKQEKVIPSSSRPNENASPKSRDNMLNHQPSDLINTSMQLPDRSTTPFRKYKDQMMQSTLDTVPRVQTPTRRLHEERLRQLQREKIMRMYSTVDLNTRSSTPEAVKSADGLAKEDSRSHTPASNVGPQNAPFPSDSTISCISLTSIEERQFFHQLDDDEDSNRQSIAVPSSLNHTVIAARLSPLPPIRPLRAFQASKKALVRRRLQDNFRRFGTFVLKQLAKLSCTSKVEDLED